MNTTLVVTGAVFIAAAIVGQGLEGAGIKIPALDKRWQHVCLAGLGAAVIAIGALPQFLANSPSLGTPAPSQLAATTAPAAAAPAATTSGPSVVSAPTASATGNVQLVNTSAVAAENDGYVVGSATIYRVTYQNALIGNGDICASWGTVTYQPAGQYKHFHALVGVSDDSPSGENVIFSVTVDNGSSPAGNTQTMHVGEAPQPIDVNIAGAFRITLSAVAPSCVFNGTAAWIGPVLS